MLGLTNFTEEVVEMWRRYEEVVKETEGKKFQRGMTIWDILIWGGIVALVAGIIFFVAKPKIDEFKIATTIKSELLQISQGLSNYQGNNYRYPSGTGWAWNAGGLYVPQEVVNKGWQYSCSGGVITVTTPAIQKPNIRVKIQQQFQTSCDAVNVVGSAVQCIWRDRPC